MIEVKCTNEFRRLPGLVLDTGEAGGGAEEASGKVE